MGMFECGKGIYNRNGIAGFYKGLGMSLVGIAPYLGINLATFDILKGIYLPDRNHKHFDIINLTMGAVAGTIAVTLTYPTDLTRRLL